MTTPTPQTLPSKTPLHDMAVKDFPTQRYPLLLWQGLVRQVEEENFELKASIAAQPLAVAENIREGAPYDNPRFEALCREHGIWGTAQAALCAVFWRQAVAMPAIPEGMPEPDFYLDNGTMPCFYRHTVQAMIAAAPQAAGQHDDAKDDPWKPIETAPEDGTPIFIADIHDGKIYDVIHGHFEVLKDDEDDGPWEVRGGEPWCSYVGRAEGIYFCCWLPGKEYEPRWRFGPNSGYTHWMLAPAITNSNAARGES